MNFRFQKDQIEGVCETSKVVKISLHFGYLGTCLFFWGGGVGRERRGGLHVIGLFYSFHNTCSGP